MKPILGIEAFDLIENFNRATQSLYDHVGFVEDWVVCPIDDKTDMYWIVDEEEKEWVRYGESEDVLNSDGDYYLNEIYTQRLYDKWVYRGEMLTMIMVDTHCDGNKFFQYFDNAKEIKV